MYTREQNGMRLPLRRHRLLGVIVTIVAMCMLGMLFFASYAGALGDPEIRSLRLAVSAPDQVVSALADIDGTEVDERPDAASVRDAVLERTADGGVVLDEDGTLTAIIASGGGMSVARVVTTIGEELAEGLHAMPSIEDVAPLADGDPNGTVEFYGIAFLSMVSSIGATALQLLLGSVRTLGRFAERVVALIAQSAAVAGVIVLASAYWFDATPQSPGAQFVVYGVTSLAVGLAATGVGTAFGPAGSISLVLLLVALGNASSGGAVGAPLLSGVFEFFHATLPQAAAMTLTRSVLYFDGGLDAAAVLCLTAWAGGGVLLVGLAAIARRVRSSGGPGRQPSTADH